jgi:CHAT domain-containing protein
MVKTKKTPNQSGGVNISGSTVNVQGDVVGRDKVTKHFSGAPARAKKDSQNQSSKPIKILFLAANPQDSDRLRLDEEIRGIKQALLQAEYRDKFAIEQEWAVRVTDLQGHLLRHQPDIVHFSGHGSEASEIILEDKTGESQTVPTRALEQLFAVLKDNIRCVVLNACYSKKQAQAIAKHIDCVIGMSKAIGDEAAINFAVAFYQALGYGKNVKTAFDLGCVQIDLQSLNEQDTPKLSATKCDPEEIVFV